MRANWARLIRTLSPHDATTLLRGLATVQTRDELTAARAFYEARAVDIPNSERALGVQLEWATFRTELRAANPDYEKAITP